jgi:hypothetical protein
MESAGIINEIWRSVDLYPNYQVSNIGRIRNTRTGKILRPKKIGHGYVRNYLSHRGVGKDEFIHRLVATEFIENPDDKPFVDHIDGNPSNNCVSNLRWCSASENMMNRQKRKTNGFSCYKGDSFDMRGGKFVANIKKNNRQYHLGDFDNEKDAARAYNRRDLRRVC